MPVAKFFSQAPRNVKPHDASKGEGRGEGGLMISSNPTAGSPVELSPVKAAGQND